jgi:hypothetical protein
MCRSRFRLFARQGCRQPCHRPKIEGSPAGAKPEAPLGGSLRFMAPCEWGFALSCKRTSENPLSVTFRESAFHAPRQIIARGLVSYGAPRTQPSVDVREDEQPLPAARCLLSYAE